jgi:hypothetical protein
MGRNSNLLDYGIIVICVTVWIAVGWRMEWDALLLGQVPLFDFDIYYQTITDVIAGNHPLHLPYMQTAGPPSVILAYLPFVVFPLEWARAAIGIISLVSVIIGAWILARHLFPVRWLVMTCTIATLWLIAFPTRFNLGLGQPNLIIMALVSLLLVESRVTPRSILAAVMAVIKTNYLVMIAGLEWPKTALRAVVIFFALIVVGFVVIKPGYYADFLTERAHDTINQGAVITDVDYYNQSLKSTLARFHLGQLYAPLFWISTLLSFWYLVVHKDVRSGIILSLLLSPLLWQHYVVVVYPIVISVLASKDKRLSVILATMAAMMLLSVEFSWLQNQPITFSNSLIGSHYFFGLCLLLIATIRQKKL